MSAAQIDPRTKRPLGDHGPAHLAIEYALMAEKHDHDGYNQLAFLEAWREGNAFEEWPEFYDWLRKQEGTRH